MARPGPIDDALIRALVESDYVGEPSSGFDRTRAGRGQPRVPVGRR
jgi:hypothetical protein